jgi:hypothetical protein
VKLADKTCNLRDIAAAPPADWSVTRRQEYFDWAKRVVDALPQVSSKMREAFEQAYAARPQINGLSAPTERDGHWLSMPGPFKGMSGFVRVIDSGDIEVELFDHSEGAQNSFGGDVSTIYTVLKADLPALAERLALGFGGAVTDMAVLHEKLTEFIDVQMLIMWLTEESGVPFTKRVDFEV